MSSSYKPFVIAISGGTGSGKTFLTDLLSARYRDLGVSLLDQDSYYRDNSHLHPEARAKINFDHPSAFDHELLLTHMRQLISGEPVKKPQYCFASHTRGADCTIITPSAVIIVEGIFAFWHPEVRSLANLKVYVDADPDLRFIRRLRRDVLERGRTVESVVDQYITSVRPMHQAYVEPTRSYADFVIENNSETNTEFLVAAIDRAIFTEAQPQPPQGKSVQFFSQSKP